MGELLCPCLVQGSVGVVYPVRPQEEQPQWRGSSGNLDSAPAGTPELSVCRAWRLRGGAADLLSWGRSVLAVLGPPGLCLSRGEAGSWAVSRRPVLRSLRWWIRAPGAAQPPPRSRPRAPRAAPVPPCALQPLGSSAHSPGRAVALFLSRGTRGHPRPPGSCSTSPRAPFPREGRCSSCSSGTGLSCPGDTRPGLSPAPRGPLPLGGLCFFISFSPSSYLDRSANSSHCCIPAGLSLNLRPNS